MSEPDNILDVDFDAQMRGLSQQAEKSMSSAAAASAKPSGAAVAAKPAPEKGAPALVAVDPPKPAGASLPQMLRPVVLGLEAVSRATGENTNLLQKLDKVAADDAEARADLPKIVGELRAMLEMKSGVNQSMFTALHQELKGYKDGFLLDSIHRPIIRDLITLYDDLTEIHRQVGGAILEGDRACQGEPASVLVLERMKTVDMNIEHNLEFILEVLARFEVSQMSVGSGKLDKSVQRAVAVEMAEHPDEDTDILRTVRRGFMWKERVLRAEEVVIKKWKEGFLVAIGGSPNTSPRK